MYVTFTSFDTHKVVSQIVGPLGVPLTLYLAGSKVFLGRPTVKHTIVSFCFSFGFSFSFCCFFLFLSVFTLFLCLWSLALLLFSFFFLFLAFAFGLVFLFLFCFCLCVSFFFLLLLFLFPLAFPFGFAFPFISCFSLPFCICFCFPFQKGKLQAHAKRLDDGWPESEEKYIEICNCGGRRALHRKEEIHDKVSQNTELCWNRVSMYL